MRRSHAAAAIGSLVSERSFMTQLVELATICGYDTIHHRPAMRANGRWMTPTAGSGAKGEPDLFLYRPGRHLWIEAKSQTGVLSADQKQTIAAMRAAGCEVHVLRPADLDRAAGILSGDIR
jgi:hypothetical protein